MTDIQKLTKEREAIKKLLSEVNPEPRIDGNANWITDLWVETKQERLKELGVALVKANQLALTKKQST